MTLTIPTILTLMRIALLPVLVVVYYLPYEWAHPAAAFIFVAAAITDWFDGYLARKLGQESKFGAFLDPVADKLMVAASLVLLAAGANTVWVTVPAMVIIGREITISALREWMAEIGQRGKIAVSYIGKVKTTAQMVALICLLYGKQTFLGLPIAEIGFVALYAATVLTLWSMIDYLKIAIKG